MIFTERDILDLARFGPDHGRSAANTPTVFYSQRPETRWADRASASPCFDCEHRAADKKDPLSVCGQCIDEGKPRKAADEGLQTWVVRIEKTFGKFPDNQRQQSQPVLQPDDNLKPLPEGAIRKRCACGAPLSEANTSGRCRACGIRDAAAKRPHKYGKAAAETLRNLIAGGLTPTEAARAAGIPKSSARTCLERY